MLKVFIIFTVILIIIIILYRVYFIKSTNTTNTTNTTNYSVDNNMDYSVDNNINNINNNNSIDNLTNNDIVDIPNLNNIVDIQNSNNIVNISDSSNSLNYSLNNNDNTRYIIPQDTSIIGKILPIAAPIIVDMIKDKILKPTDRTKLNKMSPDDIAKINVKKYKLYMRGLFEEKVLMKNIMGHSSETYGVLMKLTRFLAYTKVNLISSAYSFGNKIANSLVTRVAALEKVGSFVSKLSITLTKQVLSKVGITVGAKVGTEVALTSAKAIMALIVPIGTVIDVVLEIFQLINLSIDLADTNGYNMLDKMNAINRGVKEQIQTILDAISSESTIDNPVAYPSVVGPLCIFQMTDMPLIGSENNLFSSSLPPADVWTSQNYNSSIEAPKPTKYSYLLNQEMDILMSPDSTDSVMIEFFNDIRAMQANGYSSTDIQSYIAEWIELNSSMMHDKIDTKLCQNNGGFMTIGSGNKLVCSFTQEKCVNLPVKPDPNCKLIPNPDHKCKDASLVKMICPNENATADNDIMKGWSTEKNKCLSVNNTIKVLCEINNLEYDLEKDICIMTENTCRSKAGKPIKLADGTMDCQIPIGQTIAEAIIGKTLVDTLIQTFDPDQYEDCRDGFVDVGKDLANTVNKNNNNDFIKDKVNGLTVAGSYFCRKNCKTDEGETDLKGSCWIKKPKLPSPPCDPGYNINGLTCNAITRDSKLTLPGPNKCPDGFELQGLGPLCLQKECNDGDKSTGLLCQSKCREGFKDNGAGICSNDKLPLTINRPREKCDIGYKYDGVATCWMDGVNSRGVGIPLDNCKDGYTSSLGICWENCPSGIDKGATCETCPDGLTNNGASNCYQKCDNNYTYDGSFACNFNPVTVGVGRIPNQCPNGWTNVGGTCIKNPDDDDYKIGDIDIVNYWLKLNKVSYYTDAGIIPNQDNSACNRLTSVINGVGSCTGTDGTLNCKTTGCGCIKQSSRDCSSCNGLKDVIYGIGNCTGNKGC